MQRIVAVAAVEPVIAAGGDQRVLASQAVEFVVARAIAQGVGRFVAVEPAVAGKFAVVADGGQFEACLLYTSRCV